MDSLLAPAISMQDNLTLVSLVICLCRGVIALVGIIGNAMTIRTFVAMGLKDGVTISFLFLSVCDLLFLVCESAGSISCAFARVEVTSGYKTYFPVDPYSVDFYLELAGSEFYHCAMITIIFLAVVRCLSVATPLWFRQKLATKKVSLVVMTTTATFIFFVEVPIFAFMGIIPQPDIKTNTTRALFWTSPTWHLVTDVIWTMTGLLLTNFVQLVLLISAISMKIVLTKALEFRRQHASKGSASSLKNTTRRNKTNSPSKLPGKFKLSSKEIRITQQLFVLCLAYIVSNTPRVCLHPPLLLFPELSLFGKYGRLYEALDVLVHMCQCIFCCGNVLIYLKYNSKFRDLFSKHVQKIQ